MSIYVGSRYADVQVTEIRNSKYPDGRPYIHPRAIVRDEGLSSVETTVEGDSLEALAYFSGGDSIDWYVLADLNNIQNPLDLKGGVDLIVPRNLKIRGRLGGF